MCLSGVGIGMGRRMREELIHAALSGSLRVLRGGSWSNGADYARCANRLIDYPNCTDEAFGFRCVRGL